MNIDWTTLLVALITTFGIFAGGFLTFRAQMRKEMREDRSIESTLRLEQEKIGREYHAKTDALLWDRVTNEFARLQEQLTTVQAELAVEKAARQDLAARVRHLEEENTQLTERVRQLERENRELRCENTALERQIDTLSKVD
jgi:chromosome segregation ATPase